MTLKQIERVKKKISDIKTTLASEKRKFGGYDDSHGFRYLPTKDWLWVIFQVDLRMQRPREPNTEAPTA